MGGVGPCRKADSDAYFIGRYKSNQQLERQYGNAAHPSPLELRFARVSTLRVLAQRPCSYFYLASFSAATFVSCQKQTADAECQPQRSNTTSPASAVRKPDGDDVRHVNIVLVKLHDKTIAGHATQAGRSQS
jgi:hypothetical protein